MGEVPSTLYPHCLSGSMIILRLYEFEGFSNPHVSCDDDNQMRFDSIRGVGSVQQKRKWGNVESMSEGRNE